ncbi:MAG: AI-2E family transporter [Nitrospirota bacterium]|nr:AI-2E family transporter [Nitrospirota bacterium]
MSNSKPLLTRAHIFAAVFFAIFLFLLYQGGKVLAPFLSSLLWAAIITLALYKPYQRLLGLLAGRSTIAAATMTVLVLVLVIAPAVVFLAVLASQSVDLYQWAAAMIRSGGISEAWDRMLQTSLGQLAQQLPLDWQELRGQAIGSFGDLSSSLASQLGSLLKNTLLLTLNVLITIISLFFFFRDGESYYRNLLQLLPFTDQQKDAVAQRFSDTFSAVINGVFLIALIQGVVTGIGFAIFGVGFSVLWGFVAAVMALFPIGGAAVVWLGGAGYLFLTGHTVPGILLTIWGTVLVSLPDNFLRPLIIGRKAKLPTFLLFIGILGGIRAYGFLGILFGPVIVTLLLAFVNIYREEFAEKH